MGMWEKGESRRAGKKQGMFFACYMFTHDRYTSFGNPVHFLIISSVHEPFKILLLHLPFILKAALIPLVTTAMGEQRNSSRAKLHFSQTKNEHSFLLSWSDSCTEEMEWSGDHFVWYPLVCFDKQITSICKICFSEKN